MRIMKCHDKISILSFTFICRLWLKFFSTDLQYTLFFNDFYQIYVSRVDNEILFIPGNAHICLMYSLISTLQINYLYNNSLQYSVFLVKEILPIKIDYILQTIVNFPTIVNTTVNRSRCITLVQSLVLIIDKSINYQLRVFYSQHIYTYTNNYNCVYRQNLHRAENTDELRFTLTK